jgi:hypothetical protein
MRDGNIPLFVVFYTIHKSNWKKVDYRITKALNSKKIKTWYFWQDGYEIDNDINDGNSALEFLYPQEEKEDELAQECRKQIETKVTQYCKKNSFKVPQPNFYRNQHLPNTETLFENAESRNRFERIILTKSLEIYNKANLEELRMRPLGYGLYTDMSFGFGTLVFSWRNVPFNTPLVFWYEHKGWTPLFKRKFTTYGLSFQQILKRLS